jgi:uncharacterized YigZ family protein
MPPAPLPDSYLTLDQPGEAEIKIQRSRFLGLVAPAENEAAAREVIAEMGRRFHDSRHVCHGWRLGFHPQPEENRNDDGEPSGTAGEPILTAIRQRNLTDTVGVVVRYFGGIKLGTGGLQRAYGEAARLALAQATTREVLLGRTFSVNFPYSFQKTLGHLLENHRGKVQHEEYSHQVAWRIWLPHSTWERFTGALEESSAGKISLTSTDVAK